MAGTGTASREAAPHATDQSAGELRWIRHDNADYRAPLPPAPCPQTRRYVVTAARPPQDRQVMPAAVTSTGIDGDLPRYPASMSPAEHSVPTGLAVLDHVVLGKFGDTVREAVSYNGGHTRLGFLTVTDDGRFTPLRAIPPGPDRRHPSSVGRHRRGRRRDQRTLVVAANTARRWFGPFESRGLAEAFLLGQSGGSGLLALAPPPVPDEDAQEELVSLLSASEIAGIGSSFVGRPVQLPAEYDVLEVYELPDTRCQVVLMRDRRGLYAFVCGHCEHGDSADCPHFDCPVGYCDRRDTHKIGYRFDHAGRGRLVPDRDRPLFPRGTGFGVTAPAPVADVRDRPTPAPDSTQRRDAVSAAFRHH